MIFEGGSTVASEVAVHTSFDPTGGIEHCCWESLPQSPASSCHPHSMAQLI